MMLFFITGGFLLISIIFALKSIWDKELVSFKNLCKEAEDKFFLDYDLGEEVYILFRHKVQICKKRELHDYLLDAEKSRDRYMIGDICNDMCMIFDKENNKYYINKKYIISATIQDKMMLILFWDKVEQLIKIQYEASNTNV